MAPPIILVCLVFFYLIFSTGDFFSFFFLSLIFSTDHGRSPNTEAHAATPSACPAAAGALARHGRPRLLCSARRGHCCGTACTLRSPWPPPPALIAAEDATAQQPACSTRRGCAATRDGALLRCPSQARPPTLGFTRGVNLKSQAESLFWWRSMISMEGGNRDGPDRGSTACGRFPWSLFRSE